MNRLPRPVLACGLALLLVGLLAALITLPAAATASPAGPRPAACEPSNEIRVPDDCPTIQAALDVVYDQGQINVRETSDAASTYRENLVISRSVVIYGGWDASFSASNGLSTVDAQRLGRGVTISGTDELMVVIRALTVVSGTATGLGGLTPSAAFEISEGYTGTTGLAAAAVATSFRGVAGDDCGGGIYARNAHLRLYNVQVQDNIASTTGRGFGGGVCVVDVPDKNASDMAPPFTPGVRIEEGSAVVGNTASTAAEGAGGGVFAANAAGRITFAAASVTGNLASPIASAYGGGVFGTKLASYFHGSSEVTQNVASRSADPAHFGRGGGVAVVEVRDTAVSGNQFDDNVAATGTRGYGGGLYLRQTGDGFELRGTEYTDNRASAATNAAGYGGGLFLEDAANNESNFLRLNAFRGNVAAAGGQGGGGGVFVTSAPEMKVLLNQLVGNRAVETAGTAASFGGGLALVDCRHPMVENNRIENNMAAVGGGAGEAIHRGGGVFLSHTDELLFGENQIITNTAALNLPGEGGGVYLAESASSDEHLLRILDNVLAGNQASQGGGMLIRNAGEALVRHNHFTGNAATGAQSVGANAGGGLLIEQTAGSDMIVTVDRNHFLRNTVGPLGASGGGAALLGIGQFTLENNVFAGNQGPAAAGLYLAAHATAQQAHEAANNTFSANVGPAMGVRGWNNPPFTFHNTIIANGPVGVQVPAGSAVVMDYTLWHETPARGGGGGAFNDLHPVTGDPVFVGVANDDYHVRKTSAARDAGDPAGIPPAPEVDLASAARPFGERVDIGAYEWRDAIHWPNDYPLLKDAIDAALPGDGDTILALGQGLGGTEEQIRITKSITLSGAWDAKFAQRNPHGPTFWINQPGVPGRFITIEGGPDVVVKIEGFSFSNGDASGQGGISDSLDAARIASGRSVSTQAALALRSGADLKGPASPAAARDAAAQLGATGRLPAEAITAVETLIGRLEEAARQAAETAAHEASPARSAAAPQAEIDCGGAILSRAAGFYLSESYFERNIASKSGDGYGGAVCVLDAPANQLVISDVEMRYNLGSGPGNGLGGALYIANAPGARLSDLHLFSNVASAQGPNGEGGALLVVEAGGLALSDSVLDGNIASGVWGAESGAGGGAEIWDSPGARITGNTFRGNLGGPMCGTCRGGGLNLGRSADVQVTGNDFKYNIAGIMEWAVGNSGGGLSLDAIRDSQVLSNTFTANSASVGGAVATSGGGIYGIALSEVLFAGNTLAGNSASQVGTGRGGGAYFEPAVTAPSEKLTFRNNRFVGNAASLSGPGIQMGGGGGMELFVTTDVLIQGNAFDGNRVGEAVGGFGGGVLLRSSTGELGGAPAQIRTVVDGNLFTGNIADFGESSGGGLAGSGVKEYTVINNVFTGNHSPNGGALSMHIGDTTGGSFSGAVVNNTLYNNTDSGIFLYGGNQEPFVISNTIIVSHTLGVSLGEDTKIALAYTLWNDVAQRSDQEIEDRQPITGPVNFVDAAAGNFRIRLESAARDAGDPAGVPPAPDHDADGVRRPFGARVDIGAYEWHGTQLFMPVVRKASGVSLDTSNWTQRTSPTRNGFALLGIAYANDTYIAVGQGGIILASPDGLTWTAITSGTTVDLLGIEYINSTFYVVGGNGTILTSQDGVNWSARTLDETKEPLASIAYGNNTYIIIGGHQSAVDPSDKQGIILTSPDGSNWTVAKQTQGLALSQIAYGNGLFVAVSGSSKDTLFTSVDGVTWTERSIPGNDVLYSVTYGSGRFVAVGANGLLLTSRDGITWTVGNSTVDRGLYDGIYVQNTFVVVGSPPPGQTGGTILVSTDGVTWEQRDSGQDLGERKILRGIAYGNRTNTLVAVGFDGMIEGSGGGTPSMASATIAGGHGTVSPGSRKVAYHGDVSFVLLPDAGYKVASITDNGVVMPVSSPYVIRNMTTDHTVVVTFAASADPLDNWNINSSEVAKKAFLAVATGSDTAVAVGVGGVIAVSLDGITWTDVSPAQKTTRWGITFGNGVFVAVGENGTATTSPDGANWTSRTVSPNGVPLIGVTYGNNLFVAVGSGGTVYTSPDGITWTWRRTGVDRDLVAVIYGHDKFVAVGTSGAIVTSGDGITWTRRDSGTSLWINGIAYGNHTYIAVADRTILTSADGITWQVQGTPLSLTMTGIRYLNNSFVVVGSSRGNEIAGILTSPDGIVWTARNPVTTTVLWGCASMGNRFIAVGGIPTSGKGAIVQTP